MPTSYLHPILITLDDLEFSKVDVSTAGVLSQALFAVDTFGTLNQPSVTLDRVAGSVTYTGTAAVGTGASFNTSMTGATGAATIDEYSCSEPEANYPAVLRSGGGASEAPDQILLGMIFCKMVQSIFTGSPTNADLTTNLDVTDVNVRTNGLFFDGDGGADLVTDILAKTNGANASNTGFARVITHTGGTNANADAEYDYWNVRTDHGENTAPPSATAESNAVAFADDDKVYVKYSMNGSFVAGTTLANSGQLSALETNATALATSPFENATVQLSFILGWVVTGLS